MPYGSDSNLFSQQAKNTPPLEGFPERVRKMTPAELKRIINKAKKRSIDVDTGEILDSWWFERYEYLMKYYG